MDEIIIFEGMISPEAPHNESQRLSEVNSYGLLDTLPEEEYDAITNLIADICEVPISLVTLLDVERNFLKSHHGVPFNESPRSISFCGHAILQDESIFEIEDSRIDERFMENPLVTDHNAIFYAGTPLISPQGYPLGTLCVFDTKPRKLNQKQRNALITLGRQVVQLFELRKKNLELSIIEGELKKRNVRLKKFAGLVSHDLKSPLANITSLIRLLKEELAFNSNNDSAEYLGLIEESSRTLQRYIDGMLEYYRLDEISLRNNNEVILSDLFSEIQELFNKKKCRFTISEKLKKIRFNKTALMQIFLNLISNSIKYNDNEIVEILILAEESDTHYHFEIEDNGIGIREEHQKKIFDLFVTTSELDKYGEKGSGIGLATVHNLVTKSGGTISLKSEKNMGSKFIFSLKKPH